MCRKITFAFVLGLITVGLSDRAPGEDYQVYWNALGSGGGSSADTTLQLQFTLGEAVAGKLISGKFTLFSGFQAGAAHVVALGDCDWNGMIQLNDFACFANCFTGPIGAVSVDCALFDFDADGDVDNDDYMVIGGQFEN